LAIRDRAYHGRLNPAKRDGKGRKSGAVEAQPNRGRSKIKGKIKSKEFLAT
jgi:hypothetical protein